jgi:type VI secretion system protein ImpG
MADEFLKYYKEELAYFQEMATEYLQKYPKVAARLGITRTGITDPHLADLLHTYAISSAKLRYRLEDDFPEVIHPLMLALQPHYHLPAPSMSIVQIQPDFEDADAKMTFPKGEALTMQDLDDNEYSCRTCYDTTVWPITLEEAKFTTQTGDLLKKLPRFLPTKAVLTLTLSCSDKVSFQSLAPTALRFFINAPKEPACLMHEWLMCQTNTITLLSGDDRPISIEPEYLRAVGFDEKDEMLPYGALTPKRHRLLTEFFNLPEKFLFFEVQWLDRALRKLSTETKNITLVFSFGESNSQLERNARADWFQLGCTPVVNLFEKEIEPFLLSSPKTEYLLNPDPDSLNVEVYSLDTITGKRHCMAFRTG